MPLKINAQTLALVPCYGKYGEPQTLVIKEGSETLEEGHPMKLIEETCLYYGSSMRGRIEAARHILGPHRKTPVLIDWEAQTIFFPTGAKEKAECIWINFKQMKSVQKNGKQVRVEFQTGQAVETDVSAYSIERQRIKTLELAYEMQRRFKSV
ncbi:competence protein ComK [Exiguobacterium flavidum]|uniref:competence protein ComK n=1 Tax=Exiguobacterium flavidum TaxID=2184695 RepID=UPI000DF73960|nr:competence protein ComK [Exiguobacterium flavidum]